MNHPLVRQRTWLVVAVVLAGLIGAFPSASFAKPKKIYHGCTLDQLHSRLGQSCDTQATDDLVKGHGYVHQMFCDGEEMSCCTVENGTGRILTCRKAPLSMVNPNVQNPRASGSVLSRGTERDESGEDSPPPSWLTESWLQEHAGDKKPE